ncbi:hypothetical protein [Hellea balneolensis]|uniref:hypothetical protein n=1 Tax=Hellea balneolensis TaxID=287478 RepID=UPI0003F70DC9|nr:hypothetical protein [Hellea balneolensis]
MFEQVGFKVGVQDGYQDALEGKRSRPHPKLALCLIAQGYQENYLTGYHLSYNRTKHTLLKKQVNKDQNIRQEAGRTETLLFERAQLQKKTLEQKNQTRQGGFDREV